MTLRVTFIIVAVNLFAPAATSFAQQPRPVTAPSHPMIAKGLDASGALVLTSQKSAVLQVAGTFKRISVGSPDIADVSAVGPTQILVTGKSPGETSLTMWDENDHFDMIDIRVTGTAAPSPRIPGSGGAPAASTRPAVTGVSPSALPGFVQFNFADASVNVAANQIVAVVVRGKGSEQGVEFTMAASAGAPLQVNVPASVVSPEQVLDVVKHALTDAKGK